MGPTIFLEGVFRDTLAEIAATRGVSPATPRAVKEPVGKRAP